ncbi:unnamed protein product [Rhizoctonia solani]|nr:unnamed protein product [Rhizoctonia solani]
MVESDRYYFYAPSGWYYFDDYRKVYLEDGSLVHDASIFGLGKKNPIFHIYGVPYWFSPGGLLSLDAHNIVYRVHTWHSRYYFHMPNGLHYFDYRQNVYSDKGILVFNSSSNTELGELLPSNFWIDGASYWFDLDVLWCQASIDTRYRVYTWQSEPNWNIHNKEYFFFASGHFYHLDIRRNLYSEDGTLIYDCSSSVPADNLHTPNFHINDTAYWLHKNGLLSRTGDGTVCRILAWVRSPPMSPSNISTTAVYRGTKTSLFDESDLGHIQSTAITFLQDNTATNADNKAQPTRERGNKDHLRCPFCAKECRRVVALREHIRTHTGEKSEVCPFTGCNIGFATRSNLRRHFASHRAGTLKEYLLNMQPDVGPQPSMIKPGKAARVSTAPHKLHAFVTTGLPIPEKTISVLLSKSIEGEEERVEEEEEGTEPDLGATEDSQTYISGVFGKRLDGSIQPRPTSPEIDKKYYFHASSCFYYFDKYQRLYSEDGTLIYDGSLSFQADERSSPTFLIDGVPYWFSQDNLMYQESDCVRITHVWQSGPEVIGRNMSMHEMFHHLIHHGCTDLSSKMDTQQDTAMIINGGGFGDIWLGKMNNGTQVAIKAWRAPIIEQCDYKILKRATREIYLWSRLKHENIQPLMGVIIFKGHYLGMVSQWMENGNLHGYMRKSPNFDRYKMSLQVTLGLAYMHQFNAVHGDLRTANVLVSSDNIARLTDFGLSTMSEAGLAFSETTTTQAGTVRWASPEQLLEGSSSSKESDVYALGMTILVRLVYGVWSPY